MVGARRADRDELLGLRRGGELERARRLVEREDLRALAGDRAADRRQERAQQLAPLLPADRPPRAAARRQERAHRLAPLVLAARLRRVVAAAEARRAGRAVVDERDRLVDDL